MINELPTLTKQSWRWTAALGILTCLHHVYGGIVYSTSWRINDIIGGIAFLILCYVLYLRYTQTQSKPILMWYLAISTVIFALAIGMYEGLYNHILKNILYFGGLDRNIWAILFPAPLYEVPSNWLFEISGIAQALLGVGLIISNIRLLRAARTRHNS